jgi:hypothetical protein
VAVSESTSRSPLNIKFNVSALAFFVPGESSWNAIDPLLFNALKSTPPIPVSEKDVESGQPLWPLYVLFSDLSIEGCDFVLSAIGVKPNTSILPQGTPHNEDGGIAVDEYCQVKGVPHLYAAGDVASMRSSSPHWFQMRLWSQARLMGLHTGRCMAGWEDELGGGFNFELFSHVTEFFGYRIILLGLFNGQTLPLEVQDEIKNRVVNKDGVVERRGALEKASDIMVREGEEVYESKASTDVKVYVRITPGEEYIKIIVYKGKVVGAILIGDTDLEDTFENVIMSGVDVSHLGVEILNPDVDIEDYFD